MMMMVLRCCIWRTGKPYLSMQLVLSAFKIYAWVYPNRYFLKILFDFPMSFLNVCVVMYNFIINNFHSIDMKIYLMIIASLSPSTLPSFHCRGCKSISNQ